MHPYKMLMILGIIGISMIFVFLIIAYTVSMSQAQVLGELQLPKIFTIGTMILMVSSYTLTLAGRAYDEDDLRRLHYALLLTLLFGAVFMSCQLFGWLELKERGVFLAGRSSGTFLYILTGLHLMHLVGGMLLLTAAAIRSFKVSRDPVKALITVTNPFEKLRLELVSMYWHFLGGLWLLLYFYFLFTY